MFRLLRWVGVLALLLMSKQLCAQVYTWKDESGKIHYSDQRRVDSAQATQIDIGTMPAPVVVTAEVPVSFPQPLAPLVLEDFSYSQAVSAEGKELITYYFGGDCVSPTSQDFNQLRTTFPRVLRDEKNLLADVFRALRLHAYGNLYRSGHYSTPDLTDTQAYQLSGEIIDLDINACRSQLSTGAPTSDLQNSKPHHFDLLNVWLQVRWRLTKAGAPSATLTVVTEGVAATRLDHDLKLTHALQVAFEMATYNFIARDDFRQPLKRGKTEAHNQAAQEVTGVSSAGDTLQEPTEADPLALERLHYEQALRRSNFVQVLQEISLLKSLIAEHYQMRGVMPLTFDDIGISREHLTLSRYIDLAQMRAPGVVYIELAEEHQPGSHFVELTPEHEDLSFIRWRCTTSLPATIAGRGCENP